MNNLAFFPLSENAIMIDYGEEIRPEINKRIHQLSSAISAKPFPGFIESVPAYTTLTVYYNPLAINSRQPYEQACFYIEKYLPFIQEQSLESRTVHLPVCYDEEFALDLAEVADRNNLSVKEVIKLHTNQEYYVYFIGFAPGFPFLGGLDPSIAAPRRRTPRRKTPAGSVGIAGRQTGVYPLDIPGGWQIIGRTPKRLLNLQNSQPALLQPGDQVRFQAISKQAFLSWEEKSWH
ncbi:5-oxoprolinase subunit PxpB [Sediminibacillus albus]|uniref:Inhibitor of KinA n=1 Tax=Sediminibacillus albus TaxID=407036 RepID=A0A1G8YJ59_9BACI|nr:5-oxoprolinase subunit PxpB [Sediminibacillus albus]SDK02781.1 inhibitor of KinA [Sediminibacillus albus]